MVSITVYRWTELKDTMKLFDVANCPLETGTCKGLQYPTPPLGSNVFAPIRDNLCDILKQTFIRRLPLLSVRFCLVKIHFAANKHWPCVLWDLDLAQPTFGTSLCIWFLLSAGVKCISVFVYTQGWLCQMSVWSSAYIFISLSFGTVLIFMGHRSHLSTSLWHTRIILTVSTSALLYDQFQLDTNTHTNWNECVCFLGSSSSFFLGQKPAGVAFNVNWQMQCVIPWWICMTIGMFVLIFVTLYQCPGLVLHQWSLRVHTCLHSVGLVWLVSPLPCTGLSARQIRIVKPQLRNVYQLEESH